MAQPRNTARTRTRARQQRQRQQSPALAAFFSALTILLVGVVILTVMLNLPGTTMRNFWLLNQAPGGVSPSSDLYRQFLDEIERQEVLFLTPVSLLCGGIVLGRLTPRRITRSRLLKAAGGVSAGIVIACVAFRWGLILLGQHGRLITGEIDSELIFTQLACSVGWIAAYMLGVWLGVVWRDAGHRDEAPPVDQSFSALSR